MFVAYICDMDRVYTLDEIGDLAASLVSEYKDRPIWAFNAPMGAGKTTLIAALCRALGVTDHVTSPTFALMNEYHANGKVICHMDWYRLENEGEASLAGLGAAIETADYCFIEWPEKAPGLLPADTVYLEIVILDPDHRHILYVHPN